MLQDAVFSVVFRVVRVVVNKLFAVHIPNKRAQSVCGLCKFSRMCVSVMCCACVVRDLVRVFRFWV